MGYCLSKQFSGSKPLKKREELKDAESILINLLYEDLASRSPSHRITREIFIEFYHLTGLWGECIFHEFNQHFTGELQFDEFRKEILLLTKGSEDDKLQMLFTFYDVDRKGKITYSSLLKMFYSYPKEQLFEILNDKEFKKTLHLRNSLQLEKSSQKLCDLNKQVEDSMYQIQNEISNTKKLKKKMFSFKEIEKEDNAQLDTASIKSYVDLRNKNTRKICNITSLIKKYTEYLFNQLKLSIKDKINFSQFKFLVSRHQKLYSFYYEGFHNYIWGYFDEKPSFAQLKPLVEGDFIQLCQIPQPTQKNTYLKFMRSEILIFENKDASLPVEIKFLKGLSIEKFKRTNDLNQIQYGFKIYHHERVYKEKIYLTSNQSEYEKWITHLSPFFQVKITDKYIYHDKIGAGNFSIVYKCEKKSNHQLYALKQIPKTKLSQEELDLIYNEVNIISHCFHPNIIKFEQKIETQTHIYLINEYMKDGDLFDYIMQQKFISEYQSAFIVQQILQSVKYMNEQGLIHRDLKPENIMIIKNKKNAIEKIKIIDFGFAIYLNTLGNISNREKFVGTPNYTAPEIINGCQNYDQKIDIFSIGVILYLMLSGFLPFDGASTQDVCTNVSNGKFNLTVGRWKNISQQGRQFTQRLLHQIPKKRFSADEALSHKWITQKNFF